jgi:hypothetical protein
LRWDLVEGGVTYDVQIDDNPDFGSLRTWVSTRNSSWTPTAWLPDGAWYWRIKVYDAKGRASDYSSTGSFLKESPTTVLTAPVGGAVVNTLPTFSWRYVLTPTESPVMTSPLYRVVVDDEPACTGPFELEEVLDTTSYTPDMNDRALPDGTYYWKVALVPNSGAQLDLGPWTPVESFYKAYPLITPVSASFDPSANLKWEPQQGAAYYEIEICRDAAWSDCVERNIKTEQTTYISIREYNPGIYYWRVRMCDIQGVCGAYYEDLVGPRGLVFLPLVARNYHP